MMARMDAEATPPSTMLVRSGTPQVRSAAGLREWHPRQSCCLDAHLRRDRVAGPFFRQVPHRLGPLFQHQASDQGGVEGAERTLSRGPGAPPPIGS